MTDLFFFDPAALRSEVAEYGFPTGSVPAFVTRRLERHPIPFRMPFFVSDDDVQPIGLLNAFLRRLPSNGWHSPASWEACARDVHTLVRFIEKEWPGLSLLQVTHEHVAEFYDRRRIHAKKILKPKSWNRTATSITKFFSHLHRHGHVAALPFEPTSGEVVGSPARVGSGSGAGLRERVGRDLRIKCVSDEQYLFFRDVGLGGLLAIDGEADPEFKGRNTGRDRAFADTLITTGMRLAEACSLLHAEIPRSDSAACGARNLEVHVAAAIAKGRKARDVRMPLTTICKIEDYELGERLNAVARHLPAGGYDPRAFDSVTRWRADRCHLEGGARSVEYDELDLRARRRLVGVPREDPRPPTGPGLIWLSETGGPMNPESFDAIFRRARERCSRFGRDIPITPHTLRHCYALGMLSQLVRFTIEAGEGNRFVRVALDPLSELARLMGHASVETTRQYLTYMREAKEVVSLAIESWADRFQKASLEITEGRGTTDDDL